ncbi:esterase/lipase family protein [Longimicrobium sp.]|uniref:esterase/lipase family protein n=1 Tax=Longimicrobium sp. TaxID=2029185 RepID=UPI003B3ACBD9
MTTMLRGGRRMLGRRARTLCAAGLGVLLGVSASAAAQVSPPPSGVEARAAAEAKDTRELVVLVHGMGRSPASMWLLARRLEADGYRVLNFGYPSTRGTVAELGARLARRAGQRTGAAPRVHFIGHSLGTVVIRSMLAQDPPERMGRVVMLAPPNQGASAADRWAPHLGSMMPAIRELRTTPESTARTLVLPEGVDVGIIAGARDRKVRVAETYLPGARDHVVVNGFHSFLMNRTDVHLLIARFLRNGRFSTAAPSASGR